MDTLKTGFIVVLLLAVLYGVYVVLNKDQTPPTAEIAWHQQEADRDLQIEMGPPVGIADGSAPAESPAVQAGNAPKPALSANPATSADIGIPAVLNAQLSATPSDTPSAPAAQSTAEAVPATSNTAKEEPKQPGVSAPSLLATATEPPATPTAPLGNSVGSPVGKVTGIGPLPSLREPSATSPPAATSAETTAESASALPSNPPEPAGIAANPPAKEAVESSPMPDAALSESSKLDIRPITATAALAAAFQEAQANIAAEQWYQALFLLSKFYGHSDLTAQQQQELIDLLDPLAAKVVYSSEHLVTDPHEVRRGETLVQIAEKNQVPPQLLANINGISNPDLLVPGTKLKIVRGPFRASVELDRKELTLFAGQLYAGRFPISVGKDPEPVVGEFRVVEKQPGKVYYAGGGQTIAPEDPQNPFGRVWIGLGKELAIHGSSERGETGPMGCISLSPLDAQDVYGILSQGSSVTIRR